ncbi:MAG: DUF4159 domain-containing protein [Planctomycetia bacterium]|nr:DUF4159 domain-containing protein [Planctomycetia bacterium]
MKRIHVRTALAMMAACAGVIVAVSAVRSAGSGTGHYTPNKDSRQGIVQCANFIYGRNKSSVCFSDEFLAQIQKDTHIRTNRRFCPVKLGGNELFQYPFAVMTGEGSFTLTPTQRQNLRSYVSRGGFLVASAGCSSSEWNASFRAEIRRVFPKRKLKKLPMSHPIFHTVYDIKALKTKRAANAYLEAMEIDGKIVLIYSKEGLNDTANAGPGCCCCGGNEILNARRVNANILAYALTH